MKGVVLASITSSTTRPGCLSLRLREGDPDVHALLDEFTGQFHHGDLVEIRRVEGRFDASFPERFDPISSGLSAEIEAIAETAKTDFAQAAREQQNLVERTLREIAAGVPDPVGLALAIVRSLAVPQEEGTWP